MKNIDCTTVKNGFLLLIILIAGFAFSQDDGVKQEKLSDCLKKYGDEVRASLKDVSDQSLELINKRKNLIDSLFQNDPTLNEKKDTLIILSQRKDSLSTENRKRLSEEINNLRNKLYKHQLVKNINEDLDHIRVNRTQIVDGLRDKYGECQEAFDRLKN